MVQTARVKRRARALSRIRGRAHPQGQPLLGGTTAIFLMLVLVGCFMGLPFFYAIIQSSSR